MLDTPPLWLSLVLLALIVVGETALTLFEKAVLP